MTNQPLEINKRQKPIEGHRGTLVYRQEYGYKLITMMIDLRTPDERSRVTTWAYDFDIPEEAERLPTGSPLAAVDLYRFPATNGMEIELTIRSRHGEYAARYIVDGTGIEEHSSFLWLDVMRARDRLRESLRFPLDPDDDARS